MALDDYDASAALTAYYPDRTGRRVARIWATEKLLQDLAEVGIIEIFKGGGVDPTVLTGYATTKLWLQVSAGVTDASGAIRQYVGGDATDIDNWPELDTDGFRDYITRGRIEYQGTWNASTNSPALASSVGTKGYYYVVSVAGSTLLDGISSWAANDWVVFNGSVWQKVDNVAIVPGGTSGQLQFNNSSAFGGAAALIYASSGRHLTATAQSATDTPLRLKGAASQSANLFELLDSADVKVVQFGVGTLTAGETTARSWGLATRDALTTFPVPSFRPAATSVIALDVMPNGAPAENGGNGYAWLDVCDADCLTGSPNVRTVGLRARSVGMEIGGYNFGGALKPFIIHVNGVSALAMQTNYNWAIRTESSLGWASPGGATYSDAIDLYLTRKAAATLQIGAADAASPVAQTLTAQGVVAGTSNTAGAAITLAGAKSTGNAAGGPLQFAVSLPGSSGTSQNAWTNIFKLDGETGALLWNTTHTYNIGADSARPNLVYASQFIGSNFLASATGLHYWSGRSFLSSPADGVILAGNSTATNFTRLILGTNDNSGVSLAKSGTVMQAKLGDDSAMAAFEALTFNKVTITSPAAASTLTIADGKTLTASNTLTFTGTDSSTVAFGAGGTVGYLTTRLDQFAAPTANVSWNSKLLTNLLDPVSAQDAATKNYVDTIAQGLDSKGSVKCATTANITLSGEQTIDGVATSSSRVLVKNQSTASENGIYVSASGSWTRVTDADAWDELVSAYVFVEQGTTNADTGWTCTVNSGGTLGVTAVTFTQFNSAGSYTAGSGLQLSGLQFSIDTSIVATLGNAQSFSANKAFSTGAELRSYNTADEATNYERGFSRWSSNVFVIGTEVGGTGTSRDIALSVPGTQNILFRTNSAERWRVNGSNGNLYAGTDNVYDIGNSSTGRPRNVHVAAGIFSYGPTSGIGYQTGSGGTVTQATSKSTGVTMNKVCGQITMNNAALADATTVSFTLTNSTISSTDFPDVIHSSGGTAGAYHTQVTAVAAGSCQISVRNISGGSLSEAIVLTFSVFKGASS